MGVSGSWANADVTMTVKGIRQIQITARREANLGGFLEPVPHLTSPMLHFTCK